MTEPDIEQALIEKLGDLKYIYRPDLLTGQKVVN